MLPFTIDDLVRAVNKTRPVRTPIKDTHFTGSSTHTTDSVQLDIKTSPEGIATVISRGSKSKRAQKDGWSTITVTIPHFAEHDIVKTADLIGRRAFGKTTQERIAARVNEKQAQLRSKFDRTQEFMCIKAMQGQVVDGAGNVIATYQVPAATAATVSDGTDDPNDIFDGASVAISRALGGDPGNLTAYLGLTAYKALRKSPLVQSALNNTQSSQGTALFENGAIAKVGGVNIRRLPNVFVDNSGNEVPFLADNAVLITSDEMDGEMVYGPCEAPQSLGGIIEAEYFSYSWEENDPPSDFIRVETNPLPLVARPDSIQQFTFA